MRRVGVLFMCLILMMVVFNLVGCEEEEKDGEIIVKNNSSHDITFHVSGYVGATDSPKSIPAGSQHKFIVVTPRGYNFSLSVTDVKNQDCLFLLMF